MSPLFTCTDLSACAGDARPAVSIVHGMSQARAALRQLMQASHVGKLVVKAQRPQA